MTNKMLYLYSFSQYAGFDRVFLYQGEEKFSAGDLVAFSNDSEEFFLVLGENISFSELYTTLLTQKTDFLLIEKGFFSEQYVQLLHWMVYFWYSNYKTVMKLFFEGEIQSLLHRKGKGIQKGKKTEIAIGKQHIASEKNQILVVFPDLWTRENYLQTDGNALLLNSLDTLAKKQTTWWKIKQSSSGILIATGSEIFQDFKNLGEIYFVEPQKWYYASQQDPRYKVGTVLEKISELWNAKLIEVPSEML